MSIKSIFDLTKPLTREEAIEYYKRKKASGSEPTKSQQENKKIHIPTESVDHVPTESASRNHSLNSKLESPARLKHMRLVFYHLTKTDSSSCKRVPLS